MRTLIFFVFVAAIHLSIFVAGAKDTGTDDDAAWSTFKKHHNKKFNSREEDHRKHTFIKNRQRIREHNAEKHGYQLAENKFSDMDPVEFNNQRNRVQVPPSPQDQQTTKAPFRRRRAVTAAPSLPASIDWRNFGAVQPVKDQGQCGSCWAFSATSALESQYFIRKGINVSLSEQNIVDCVANGCNSGWMSNAWVYVKNNNGQDTEISYPYSGPQCTTTTTTSCSTDSSTGTTTCTTYWYTTCTSPGAGTCKYNATNKGATVTGFVQLPKGDENALKAALVNVGPVSIAIDASNLQSYSGGFYSCTGPYSINHAVVIVGYGTLNGTDYWLVRNSWGQNWGLNGYFMIRRNFNSTCGVADYPMYPTV